MIKDRLVVANWKMNLDAHEASVLMHEIEQRITHLTRTQVVLCPTSLALHPLAKQIDPRKFKLGAQNCHFHDSGAFTGEISPRMLAGIAEYVMIGHSERRKYFGETDETVGRKVPAVIRSGLQPIICVGENLMQRTNGETEVVLRHQVSSALAHLTSFQIRELVFGYEPVWAISSGKDYDNHPVPTQQDIENATQLIKAVCIEHFGEVARDKIKVIYGGSSNPDNAADLLSAQGCEGLLVGGASLNANAFVKMIDIAEKFEPGEQNG